MEIPNVDYWIGYFQATIDEMNADERKRRLRWLTKRMKTAPGLPLWDYVMMVALRGRVSVAQALDTAMAKFSDGTMAAIGRKGSPDGNTYRPRPSP